MGEIPVSLKRSNKASQHKRRKKSWAISTRWALPEELPPRETRMIPASDMSGCVRRDRSREVCVLQGSGISVDHGLMDQDVAYYVLHVCLFYFFCFILPSRLRTEASEQKKESESLGALRAFCLSDCVSLVWVASDVWAG